MMALLVLVDMIFRRCKRDSIPHKQEQQSKDSCPPFAWPWCGKLASCHFSIANKYACVCESVCECFLWQTDGLMDWGLRVGRRDFKFLMRLRYFCWLIRIFSESFFFSRAHIQLAEMSASRHDLLARRNYENFVLRTAWRDFRRFFYFILVLHLQTDVSIKFLEAK